MPHGNTPGLDGDGNRVNIISVSGDNLYLIASGAILKPELFTICDFKNEVLPTGATTCIPCSTELEWGINEADCTVNVPNSKFLLWEADLDAELSSTQSAVIRIVVLGATQAEFDNDNVKAEHLISAMNFSTTTNSDTVTGISAVSEIFEGGNIVLRYKLPFAGNPGLSTSTLVL